MGKNPTLAHDMNETIVCGSMWDLKGLESALREGQPQCQPAAASPSHPPGALGKRR